MEQNVTHLIPGWYFLAGAIHNYSSAPISFRARPATAQVLYQHTSVNVLVTVASLNG